MRITHLDRCVQMSFLMAFNFSTTLYWFPWSGWLNRKYNPLVGRNPSGWDVKPTY